MPAGLTLPYWLLYAIILTGISCNDEIFKTRNVHISREAQRACSSQFAGYFRLQFSICSSRSASIAFKPAGVQAHPSPNKLATILVEICSLAGWSFGTSGNSHVRNGFSFRFNAAIIPASLAISISPTHNDITPIIVMQRETASFAESSAAAVTASIFPVTAPYTTPMTIMIPQILFNILLCGVSLRRLSVLAHIFFDKKF